MDTTTVISVVSAGASAPLCMAFGWLVKQSFNRLRSIEEKIDDVRTEDLPGIRDRLARLEGSMTTVSQPPRWGDRKRY